MKRFTLIIVTLLLVGQASAHPWKPGNFVIIDTDCGLDDLRAICMMLSSPNVRVLAITVSDGVLDAESGYVKVRGLLHDLHHEGIPVGVNHDPRVKSQNCKPALQMDWGQYESSADPVPVAVDVIDAIFTNIREPITFVSLGSLNTAGLIMEKCLGFNSRVKQILWSNQANFTKGSFNYDIDMASAHSVLMSGIKINTVNTGSLVHYNDGMLQSIALIHNIHAAKLYESLSMPETPFSTTIFDEAIPLFLHYPEIFQCDTVAGTVAFVLRDSLYDMKIREVYNKILTGETTNMNQVLSVFPMDTSFYMSDVRTSVSTAVEKYGKEEWTAGVMANEMHGHLGIYAIIGVKMGIRAREYFGAGVDEMSVVSYAGLTPPFSCMNDGLQISTGATLGHGLIRIASDTLKLPVADFTYLNRKIRVSLKPEIRNKVEAEVKELSRIHGLDSDIYWDLVRNKAIRYWTAFDRHEIFTIEIL